MVILMDGIVWKAGMFILNRCTKVQCNGGLKGLLIHMRDHLSQKYLFLSFNY